MESLAGYGSDDDCEDSQEEKEEWCPTPSTADMTRAKPPSNGSGQVDVNYDEVQMDLSEESEGSDEKHSKRRDRDEYRSRHDRDRESRDSPKHRDDYRSKRSRDEGDRYRKEDRTSHGRDSDRDKDRDRDRNRDRDKYRDDRRRDRQRSRSRSPRRSDYRSRRSKSRDRDSKASKRYDRSSNKLSQGDKSVENLPEPSRPGEEQKQVKEAAEKDRFFMPGITGRFREQIEKRKLLWQKKDPEKTVPKETQEASGSRTGKLWEATTFAQDSDGKVASKFKRLMGIRNTTEGAKSTDVLKKQEEMFSSMEQQYEVARTATHTMRGVGLGFGSFQR